eukprot:COSAG05_NODE_331_length_11273_cov_3.896635_7_plen_232_part_00
MLTGQRACERKSVHVTTTKIFSKSVCPVKTKMGQKWNGKIRPPDPKRAHTATTGGDARGQGRRRAACDSFHLVSRLAWNLPWSRDSRTWAPSGPLGPLSRPAPRPGTCRLVTARPRPVATLLSRRWRDLLHQSICGDCLSGSKECVPKAHAHQVAAPGPALRSSSGGRAARKIALRLVQLVTRLNEWSHSTQAVCTHNSRRITKTRDLAVFNRHGVGWPIFLPVGDIIIWY